MIKKYSFFYNSIKLKHQHRVKIYFFYTRTTWRVIIDDSQRDSSLTDLLKAIKTHRSDN
jgi:hypothetical protein